MSVPSDTSPEAQRVLDAIHREMSAGRKWAIVEDLHQFGRELHAAGLLSRDDGVTRAQIRDDWIARHYGTIPYDRGTQRMSATGEIRATLDRVTVVLDRLGIDYALGGSMASSIYGVSRNTIDADLSVEPFLGKEAAFVGSFGADFYISRDAVTHAVRARSSFNIIETTTGFKVDVFVRKDRPFERSVMARRRLLPATGPDSRPLYVVSAEDVVLLKLEWYRLGVEISDRQWSDIVNVLRIQSGKLDQAYLDHWAADLGVSDLLSKARAEAGGGAS